MLMFIAMRAIEFKPSPYAYMAAHIVRLAGVGGANVFHGHALQHRFVFTDLLKLEERPIIAVLPGVRLRGFALPGILPDAAEVFEAQATIISLRQALITPREQDKGRSKRVAFLLPETLERHPLGRL